MPFVLANRLVKRSVAQQIFFYLGVEPPREPFWGGRMDTDKLAAFRMVESDAKCVQCDRRFARSSMGVAPWAGTTVQSVPEDAVPARGELDSDLVHTTGAERDSNEAAASPVGAVHGLDEPIGERCQSAVLVGCVDHFRSCFIGDLPQRIDPFALIGDGTVHPSDVLFSYFSGSELIAQTAKGPLVSGHDHGSARHSVESMGNTNEGCGSHRGGELLNESALDTL